MTPESERDRYSIAEVAARLGVSPRTIYRMHERGDFIPIYHFSRNVSGVLRQEYETWLKQLPKIR